MGKKAPTGDTAHSLRSGATSAVFEGVQSLEEICKGVTLAAPSAFTKHYRVDLAASAQASFGRRVLQLVAVA